MTTEYTPNYNLDLYTDNDKPNLRDQYNSAVRKIDAQLKTTNDKVTINKDVVDMKITKLDERVTIAETNITNLDERVSSAEANITESDEKIKIINNRVTELEKAAPNGFKNIVCIGDSWLEGYSSIGNYTSWGSLLAAKLNAKNQNSYKGGCGFYVTVENINFKTLVTRAASAATDATKVDCVIIGGGINDRKSNASEVQTAAAACVQEAINKFPNAKIFVFPMMLAGRFISSASMNVLRAIESGCTSVASNRVIVYGDCYDWIYDNESMHADSYHPNQNGQNAVANFMLNVLNGGCPTCHNGDATIAPANSANINAGSFIRRSGTMCSAYLSTTSTVSDGNPFVSFRKGYSPAAAFLYYTNSSGSLKTMNMKPVDSDHVGFAPSYGEATQMYCTVSWPIQDTE